MKRSELIETLLTAYYFQEGRHADAKVTTKARKMIANFKKEEEKLNIIKEAKIMDNNKEIEDIKIKLEDMGCNVNCHDGTFTAEDILENAEEVAAILKRYLEIKNK
jgi:hypothetical protein